MGRQIRRGEPAWLRSRCKLPRRPASGAPFTRAGSGVRRRSIGSRAGPSQGCTGRCAAGHPHHVWTEAPVADFVVGAHELRAAGSAASAVVVSSERACTVSASARVRTSMFAASRGLDPGLVRDRVVELRFGAAGIAAYAARRDSVRGLMQIRSAHGDGSGRCGSLCRSWSLLRARSRRVRHRRVRPLHRARGERGRLARARRASAPTTVRSRRSRSSSRTNRESRAGQGGWR